MAILEPIRIPSWWRPPSHIPPANFKDLVFAGYQGWFSAQGDSTLNQWWHWTPGTTPAPGNVFFELYPDVREYLPTDLFPTNLGSLGNGSPAKLYASVRDGVVDLHFRWMQQYGIDGAAVQRFVVEVKDPLHFPWRDAVNQKIKEKAEKYQRYYCIEYDVSGADPSTLVQDIQNDFAHLEQLGIVDSWYYARQNLKPVISLWGFSFPNSTATPSQASQLIQYFKNKGYYVVGGVTGWWRTTVPDWDTTFLQFDMIQSWSVGMGYQTDADFDNYFNNIVIPEKSYLAQNGVDYQTVISPGSAWSNWHSGAPRNQFPRRGGGFFWRQAYWVSLMRGQAKIAMFDEFDEGTAIAKAAENVSMIPTNQYFLTLDADGISMDSDFYLRLAGEATKMIKGERALTGSVPIPYRVVQLPPKPIGGWGKQTQ